jgi:mannose-6-phosphate isomerase-like protein (cupin superfamily)
MMRTQYRDRSEYVTKDGSSIRELLHPDHDGNRQQSLAEAVVAPGSKTLLHQHQHSEELYHITRGRGHMTLGEQHFDVNIGDTICILPGTPHCIRNTGTEPLHILCCCAPAYSHADTQLLE